MSSDAFDPTGDITEERLLEQMKRRASKGVAENMTKKADAEKDVLAGIFKKMNEGIIPTAPASKPNAVSGPLTEGASNQPDFFANAPSIPTPDAGSVHVVTQQINRPVPTKAQPVNNENEPTNIAWRPTTVQQLVALYPKSTAVSDLFMVLHGATQQPGMAFALLAPHGTKYLVKSDETGNLFFADPDPNPKAFANVGLNPDFDNDAVDDANKKAAKPFQTNSARVLPSSLNRVEDFNVDVNFDAKIEEGRHDTPTEELQNPRVKDAVSKLRGMAAALRGESTTQSYEKPLVVTPANVPSSQLMEDEEETLSLNKVNNLLFRVQERFNQTNKSIYENAADELSDAIAEALLTNKQDISTKKIERIMRKLSW